MAKKKKKSQSGGPAGRPVLSEPRMQIFTKFSGCNFQLSTRDFDDIFDTDQDGQTDLMPMFMAIQNNAGVVPMGGIETRQGLVKIFNAPYGKKLTGIATLIGDQMYAACDDMTIHYGTLDTTHVGVLDSEVTIDDNNQTYGGPVAHTYSGVVS